MRFIVTQNDHGDGWRVLDTALGITIGSTYESEQEAQDRAAIDERMMQESDLLHDVLRDQDHAVSDEHLDWLASESQMWDGK